MRIDSMAYGNTQNINVPIQTSPLEVGRHRSLFLTIQSVNGRSQQDVKITLAIEMEDIKRLTKHF